MGIRILTGCVLASPPSTVQIRHTPGKEPPCDIMAFDSGSMSYAPSTPLGGSPLVTLRLQCGPVLHGSDALLGEDPMYDFLAYSSGRAHYGSGALLGGSSRATLLLSVTALCCIDPVRSWEGVPCLYRFW